MTSQGALEVGVLPKTFPKEFFQLEDVTIHLLYGYGSVRFISSNLL